MDDDDDRFRKIRKRRKKKKQQAVDLGLIILSLVASIVLCLVLGLIFSALRFLILVSGGMSIIAGIIVVVYVLYAYDNESEVAPRTFVAGFIILTGIGQLFLYVMMSRSW